MDKKSKILMLLLASVIAIAIALLWARVFLKQDYLVSYEAECDPVIERCFVYVCDPGADVDCPEVEEERSSYYKIVETKAYALPSCDAESGACPHPGCAAGEADCREIFCNGDALPDGVRCSN